MDMPFNPTEWERISKMAGENTFHKYAEIFLDAKYDSVDWSEYYKRYK